MIAPTAWLALLPMAGAFAMDLTNAVVVGREPGRAAAVLVEEVEKRSQVRWPTAANEGAPVEIVLARDSKAAGAEGFRIETRPSRVLVAGADARGVLFGVGRLLRELRISKGHVELPDGFHIATTPKYLLRGHQLGYRPKTNSYDGWNVAMWDQYMRDLAVFGNNAIELIPPVSDDAPDSPHFPLPQMPMMIEMSRIAASYGLAVWVWYPAMAPDYTKPEAVQAAVDEWAAVLRQLPRLDAVFVPGGDPGHTAPPVLLALLEKQIASIRRYHPQAAMWVSPQGFSAEWMEEFLALLQKEPAWLAGVVHGPQVRMSLEELRRRLPRRYPIRNYPDITHSTHSQFVVPEWDLAHALTHYREPINPRPTDMRAIFLHDQPHTIGSITYSEGCNDDVNKVVWSALGWDPAADVTEALRQYGRYFAGEKFGEGFAQGLAALERNWKGPLATNSGVDITLQQFQALERNATPQLRANWRFQMALYRAYYDAYNRRRQLHEWEAEARAMDMLRAAPRTGSLAAMEAAERALDGGAAAVPAPELRARVFELAEALFQSVRMQLSVPRYQAIARDRGATLDNIDIPLNNRLWLKDRFAALRRMDDEAARLRGIDQIVNWTNPGPGGFYDDLGDPANQPHLVKPATYAEDPGHLRSPAVGFARPPWALGAWRTSWITVAESMFDAPVEMLYQNLDRGAQYKVRIVYGGEGGNTRVMRLAANGKFEIHPFRRIDNRTEPVEFDIPREATAAGELRLTWVKPPGLPGSGRGCQIAEVWLIRK